MFHTVNTVRMAGGDLKRFARDPIAAFRKAGQDTLGGIRTEAAKVLRSVNDIDLRPGIEDAILYGVTPKPIDAGDQAQAIGPGTSRDIQESASNIFKSVAVNLTPTLSVVYQPDRPELLHRITISQGGITSDVIAIGTAINLDNPIIGQPPFADVFFFGELDINVSLVIPLGRIGGMITATSPLVAVSTNSVGYRISLHLSQALLRR